MNHGRTVFAQLIGFLPDRDFRRCVARYDGDSRWRAPRWPTPTSRGDWRVFADFAQILIGIARPLYARDPIGVDLDHSLYALDSATIDLPETGAFYVMDRGYVDFKRLYVFPLCSAFFVVRTKQNIRLQRRYSRPVDKATGIRSDQTVILATLESAKAYPDALRRIGYRDPITEKRLTFLTNNFVLPALTIAEIYRCRWQVELFFKWIKQYLRIKAFFGASANAIKTHIWIAVSVYVLVAIVRKRLGLEASLYQILQVLSVTLFEKTPILRALQAPDSEDDLLDVGNQLILFDFSPDSSEI